VVESTDIGNSMRGLFPYIWNTNDVCNAFIGYGKNQQKKFLDGKDKRKDKYAVAYLRTLIQCSELIQSGTFTIDFSNHSEYRTLMDWKQGNYEIGEVINKCYDYIKLIDRLRNDVANKDTDLDAVNEFLLQVRKANW
jgi:predicted nucleotidyltransferase